MIPKDECIVGMTYQIDSRNLVVGVWNGEGFVGVRKKFAEEFLFTEFHWDDGPPYGTVKPIRAIEECPIQDIRQGFRSEDDSRKYIWNTALFDYLKPLDQKIRDDENFDDEVCGICGVRRPAPGMTACSTCAG